MFKNKPIEVLKKNNFFNKTLPTDSVVADNINFNFNSSNKLVIYENTVQLIYNDIVN